MFRPSSSGWAGSQRGPVALVAAPAGDRRERLEHDPVGERGGDVGVVVGRAAPRRRRCRRPAAPGRSGGRRRAAGAPTSPPGSGVPVPGRAPGRTRRCRRRGRPRRTRRSRSRTPRSGTRPGRGARSRSSRRTASPAPAIQSSVSGRRPVAAQPDLQEAVAAQRPGLDQPAHRLAVAPQRAELDVAGVGVRVEVDHRDPAVAEARWPRPWRRGRRSSGRRRGSTGMAPARATFSTAASSAAARRSMSPEYISTSPASTTRGRSARRCAAPATGREPSCGR